MSVRREVRLTAGVLFLVQLLVVRTAADCTVEVTEDMMRPLLGTTSSTLQCNDLWKNLLAHFQSTRANLAACEAREESTSTPEPSHAFCQEMLANVRADMLELRRTHQRDMALRVEVGQMEKEKLERAEQTMHQELRKIKDEWRTLTRELLLTNIGMGNVRQALKHYHDTVASQSADTVHRTILQWVYRDAKRQNQRLNNLFTFVRSLPSKETKLALYQLIKPEILNRQSQREGYLAAVAGLDAARIVFDDNNEKDYHLYTDLYDPVEKRWKGQMQAGQYGEVIAFATSHPTHYAEVENSFTTFKPDEWNRLNLNQFITFPNQLPMASQRLEALLMILLQLKDRKQENTYRDHLTKLAREVEICEALVKKSRNSDQLESKLSEVKRTFAEVDGADDYEFFLQEFKKKQQKKSG